MRVGLDGYECDCTGTGYYGRNCTTPEFGSWICDLLRPDPDVVNYILTHFQWLWDIINATWLRGWLMGKVLTARIDLIPNPPTYNTKYDYLNWEAYSNITYYTRILPPVPKDCPLPMGVKGKPELPDPDLLANKLMLRRKFRPVPQGTNLMFAFFAQHFTHQFFKTNHKHGPEFTLALGHGVDGGHIYGADVERQLGLRLLKDGKLKYQVFDGEMYPPTIEQANVSMMYPANVAAHHRLAMGEDRFGLLPGLTMYATLWLREHNRVCDILKAEHPTWDDEQLFQTARLVVIGEIIRIVIEDYVQHLSAYNFKLKFDPTLMFGSTFQYGNRIAMEFAQLYHWHPLMPDSFLIDGDEITYPHFLFNSSLLLHYGVDKLVHGFTRQHAGQIGGGYNANPYVTKVAASTIRESRQARFQPFNQYRKRFHMKPYTSFREFTDDEEMIQTLEEMYGDIDALEFYPGLVLEQPRPGAIFGPSMVEMGAPFSLKGLMGNAICAPHYWKPSTFGGKTGFDLVNSASLEKLVCLNTKSCPYVAFKVPPADFDEQKHWRKPSTEL